MMKIKPCKSYNASIHGSSLVKMRDGVSVFKIYFVSILGRSEPASYEWSLCSLDTGQFERQFRDGGFEGVGFVTAFPHITKVFRFAPSMETVMHVSALRTPDMTSLSLERDGGYMEFACLAEAVIAAEEYRFWADAATVEDYLGKLCDPGDMPVRENSKLMRYNAEKGEKK